MNNKTLSEIKTALLLINDYSNKNKQEVNESLSLVNELTSKENDSTDNILSSAFDLTNMIKMSDFKPQYQINIYDYYGGLVETGTSYFLKEILNYREDGNPVIVKSFVKTFLINLGFDISWIRSPKVENEAYNIDVLIYEKGKYAIIIENKLKGAVFQRNQLARYIATLRKIGYDDDRIFIVILPDKQDNYIAHLKESTWRLPPDWEMPNQERACKYYDQTQCLCDNSCNKTILNCSLCDKDIKSKFDSRTIILYKELSTWLENLISEILPQKETLLRSAIIQFADFLNGIYNNRINNKLLMEIEKYLRDKLLLNQSKAEQLRVVLEKEEEVNTLLSGLNSLHTSLQYEIISEWRRTLLNLWSKSEVLEKFGKLLNDEKDTNSLGLKSFSIDIKGVRCGCWCGEDSGEHRPYWGFKCENPTDSQKEMVNNIIDHVNLLRDDVGNYDTAPGWIAWNYTDNGDEICRDFYDTAVKLNFL